MSAVNGDAEPDTPCTQVLPETASSPEQTRSSALEHKVAIVAVAAMTDALQRVLFRSGDGVGLRAGSFHTELTDTSLVLTLSGCSFASDVTVSGTVDWNIDNSLVADLQVAGSGTKGAPYTSRASGCRPAIAPSASSK